jgi:hypothetical protein
MTLNYLLRDYRFSEIKSAPHSGIHLGDTVEPDYDAMSDEDYDAYWKQKDDSEESISFWVWDGDKPLFAVTDSHEVASGDYSQRPDPKVIHYAGRKFLIYYYHGGQPLTVRELDS